jgi:hypothetical protein
MGQEPSDMDTPDRAQPAHFSQPIRQMLSMLVVLGLVAFGVRLAAPEVAPVFLANPYLNGFIAFVFGIGVLTCFWQTYQVASSVRWLRGFVTGEPARASGRAPRLLAPLATLLRSRPGMMRISANASRSILDSVATRIDEARDITRYIVNLLIFLGLLGTFYGLATTVPALVETIRSLAPREGEAGLDVFSRLMSGLERQLDGMGVAFASSLLGLAGSLVVGLLELFAGHGQNRFYRELEEWLSTITRVGFAPGESDAATEGGAAFAPVLQHLSGQLDALQIHYGQSAEARVAMDARIARLTEAVEALAGRLEGSGESDPALSRIAEGQERMLALMEQRTGEPELARMSAGQDRMVSLLEQSVSSPELRRISEYQDRMVALMEETGGGTLDAESRMHLRSIDAQLLRILEEMAAGRQEAVDDLRSELAQLSRLVRQLSTGLRQEAPTPIVGRRL